MNIKTMKLVLEALEYAAEEVYSDGDDDIIGVARRAVRQAIEQNQKQKPVAYMDDKGYICNFTTNPERYTPLYAAPQTREWIGITEDEIDDIWNSYCDELGDAYKSDAKNIAVDIDARLMEKNHVY
jgi:hypothetical protein